MGNKATKLCLCSIPREHTHRKQRTHKYKAIQQVKYKLLILGAGQSGKSTLLKQFRMLHGRQFDQFELLAAKPHLTQNVIEAMRTLAIYSDIFNFWLPDEYLVCAFLRIECCPTNSFVPQCIEQLCVLFSGNTQRTKEIRDRVARMSDKQKFTQQHYEDFAHLWNDPRIKKTLEYKHQFQLIDTVEYLFENMCKYYTDDYVPTFTDLIHSYQRTTGVNKIKFAISDMYQYEEIYEIFDVGGQKNERRKWMHFFDNTTAVLFVVALSGYNELLWEDNTHNRMREAIGLFRGIVNLDCFQYSHFILFLNKSDLFRKKVGRYPIKQHFKDYEGKETYHEIIDFVIQKFEDQRRYKRDGYKTDIHFHVTCATDSNCIKRMFELCRTIIIKSELQNQGLL